MDSTADRLVNRLETEQEKTMGFFTALSEDDWQKALHTEGEHWTIRQVFQHLAESEIAILMLMKQIKSGGTGVSKEFDLDDFNERRVLASESLSLEDLFKRFSDNREKTIKWVAGLSNDDLALEGRHPFLGVVPIGDMIKLMFRHTQIHQREIRRLLQGA